MDIELFRNLLLAGLVLILIVILYKRLLRFLAGKTLGDSYSAFLGEGIIRHEEGSFGIEIEVHQKEPIHLIVNNSSGEQAIELCNADLEAGEHDFKIDKGQLSPGRYSCELNTSNQKSLRYFNVK